ncbi:hypothetical protein MTR67_038642 [Solanum verrucosum]|uniref:DUF4216 domain-containing protein n=1 Tax=Solanum verrucosum TaxID=315347 RepID=A0AAF0ZMY0_SOLVR|nr:hypothetical protein MTR67_038642 [Solanum verrucosum]
MLFMSRKTSTLMTWNKDKRVDDGIMRHLADSMAWKSFDELHPSFVAEPRNIRLGLASDGFQPFRNSKTSHSIWPVVLIPYNLPPWLCMKQENFILSMLIPGPNGPGDAIDTYLQPLIDELKELWKVGIETYDASTRTNFKLHASLLLTINDFTTYGNLSGWSTKGKMNHKWRNNKDSFDGTIEKRPPTKMCSDHKISGLKSHDYHVLLQHVLPLALREGCIAEGYIANECMTLCSREFAQTHENAQHLSDAEWSRQFIEWFKDRISCRRYDKTLITQNCGVIVLGENDEDSENLDYYGVLTDIIELQIFMNRTVVLFHCNWFDVYDKIKGFKKDEFDFVSVNPDRFLKTNEPFVLADQASQVFYANDNSNKGWKVVRKTQPHDSYEIVEQMDDDIVELGSPSQKKRKRTNEVKFKMKPLKTENEAQLEEMVQADPYLPIIEIVEKCCGPQTRSHVFGLGDGVNAKDLKGGTSSKAELLSALRSTRDDIKYLNEENKSFNEENKSLNDRLYT